MAVKSEEKKGWVILFWCHFHVDQERGVVIRDDVVEFFFGASGRSWKSKELVFFKLCNQVFNDELLSESLGCSGNVGRLDK